MTYIILVGEEPETAIPVHNIDGTLGRWQVHAEAAEAARQLVLGRITDKGAFVCALQPTAFYLPVTRYADPVDPTAPGIRGQRVEIERADGQADVDETIVVEDPDGNAEDKKGSPN